MNESISRRKKNIDRNVEKIMSIVDGYPMRAPNKNMYTIYYNNTQGSTINKGLAFF